MTTSEQTLEWSLTSGWELSVTFSAPSWSLYWRFEDESKTLPNKQREEHRFVISGTNTVISDIPGSPELTNICLILTKYFLVYINTDPVPLCHSLFSDFCFMSFVIFSHLQYLMLIYFVSKSFFFYKPCMILLSQASEDLHSRPFTL